MKTKVLNNIVFLYGLSAAKIIFPLLTLPYLTRVLSVDAYGIVAYVKAVMQYMQLTVDFGFMLSGTKDIVNARFDKNKLEKEVGDIFLARIILALLALVVLLLMILIMPILKNNAGYTLLSFFTVFLSIFLFDFSRHRKNACAYYSFCVNAWLGYCVNYIVCTFRCRFNAYTAF